LADSRSSSAVVVAPPTIIFSIIDFDAPDATNGTTTAAPSLPGTSAVDELLLLGFIAAVIHNESVWQEEQQLWSS